VWVRHGQPPNGRNSIPVHGSKSWELVATPGPADHVVDAVGHDGCYGSRLEPLLRTNRRDRVLMCGLGLEGPVHSTLRTLNDQGYECLTVTDASAPYESASGLNALSSITFSFGIFGAIAPSRSVLAAFDPNTIDPTTIDTAAIDTAAIDTAMEEIS
jgi:nicotinamidase-related amidase